MTGGGMVHACGSARTWQWNGALEAVEFLVHGDGPSVVCRVAADCIADHFGDPASPEAKLDAARAHIDEITDLATRLIAGRRYEDDGSIAIRSADWR